MCRNPAPFPSDSVRERTHADFPEPQGPQTICNKAEAVAAMTARASRIINCSNTARPVPLACALDHVRNLHRDHWPALRAQPARHCEERRAHGKAKICKQAAAIGSQSPDVVRVKVKR